MIAVKSAKHGDRFKRPPYQMRDAKLQLEMYPKAYYDSNDGNIEFKLIGDSNSEDSEFAKINLTLMISLIELNKKVTYCAELTPRYATTIQTSFSSSLLDPLNALTIRLDAEITNAVDADGNDITHLYTNEEEKEQSKSDEKKKKAEPTSQQQATLNSIASQIAELSSEMQGIKVRLNDIELKMKEEQKDKGDDKLQGVMAEIGALKQKVARLSLNQGGDDTKQEQQKLKAWLENTVCLGQYFDVFIENGVEDLDTVKLLTMNEIKGMGVDKIGHQMKLLHQIVKLKENNEGGTMYI